MFIGTRNRGWRAVCDTVAASSFSSLVTSNRRELRKPERRAFRDAALWLASCVRRFVRSAGVNSTRRDRRSSTRCSQSGSRSRRCPAFSWMDHVSPDRRVSTAGSRELRRSSSRDGVPRNRSTTTGKISRGNPVGNCRSNQGCFLMFTVTDAVVSLSWRVHVRDVGRDSPVGTNWRANPLLHQRCPVGGGPSLKTWPWCPPHRTQ